MGDKRVRLLPSGQMPLISILTAFLLAGHVPEHGRNGLKADGVMAGSLPCSIRAFTTSKMRLKRLKITPWMLLCWHIRAGMVMQVQKSTERTAKFPLLPYREFEVTEKSEAYWGAQKKRISSLVVGEAWRAKDPQKS